MSLKSSILIGGEKVAIDPQLLFQRLILIANNTGDCSLAEALQFELANYPTSLFDKSGLIREAQKPQLVDAIKTACDGETITSPEPVIVDHTVLDGDHCYIEFHGTGE